MYVMHAQQCFHPSNRDRWPTSASTLPLLVGYLYMKRVLESGGCATFASGFLEDVLQEYRGVEQGLSSYLRTGSCRCILIEKWKLRLPENVIFYYCCHKVLYGSDKTWINERYLLWTNVVNTEWVIPMPATHRTSICVHMEYTWSEWIQGSK